MTQFEVDFGDAPAPAVKVAEKPKESGIAHDKVSGLLFDKATGLVLDGFDDSQEDMPVVKKAPKSVLASAWGDIGSTVTEPVPANSGLSDAPVETGVEKSVDTPDEWEDDSDEFVSYGGVDCFEDIDEDELSFQPENDGVVEEDSAPVDNSEAVVETVPTEPSVKTENPGVPETDEYVDEEDDLVAYEGVKGHAPSERLGITGETSQYGFADMKFPNVCLAKAQYPTFKVQVLAEMVKPIEGFDKDIAVYAYFADNGTRKVEIGFLGGSQIKALVNLLGREFIEEAHYSSEKELFGDKLYVLSS